MRAAGISDLESDELESHLREEIETAKKLGLSETEIFQTAVQTIGQGSRLRCEFKKVEEDDPMEAAINSLIQIIGWVATGCVLVLGLAGLDLSWNFFSFKPTWNLCVLWAIIHILVAETGICFLAKVNRDGTSRAASLLVCLLLVWIALINYHSQLHPHGILGGEREPNPFWYRWSITSLYLVPGIFWITRRWPLRRENNQPIARVTIVAERIFSVVAAFYIISVSFYFFRIGDGWNDFFVACAALLAVLLIICGCLAFGRIGKMRLARR